MLDFFICVLFVCLSVACVATTALICTFIATLIKENFI